MRNSQSKTEGEKIELSVGPNAGVRKLSPISHRPEEKMRCLVELTEVGSKALKLILQTKTSLSSVELCVRETRVDIIVLSLY